MVDAKEWVERGKDFHEKGEYDQAIDAFKRALTLEPENTDTMIRIGLSHRHKGEYDEAIEVYDKVLELDPKSAVAWNNLGYALECKDQIERAIDMYIKSLDIDPVYELPLINLTNIYNDRKEYDKSIEVFKRALEKDPVNAPNWIDLGLAYRYSEDYDKAIDAYSQALKYDPENKIAWNNLGWAFYIKKKYEKAIDAFTRSLSIDWRYDLPYTNLNTVYQALITENNRNCVVWSKLAEGYLVARDYDYALTSCNRCLEIEPGHEGGSELQEKILKAKRKFESKSELNKTIEMALETFSTISVSVLLNDLVRYVKHQAPDLDFDSDEIKFATFEILRDKSFNAVLDGKYLVFPEEEASDS